MVCQESSYQEVSKAQSMTLYKFSQEIHGEGLQPYDIYKVIDAHRSMYNTFGFFPSFDMIYDIIYMRLRMHIKACIVHLISFIFILY